MSEITPLFISQPHHGYLRVPGYAIELLWKAYGWQPSEFSMMSEKREAIFLEEDCDLTEFVKLSGFDLSTVPVMHSNATRNIGRYYEPLG